MSSSTNSKKNATNTNKPFTFSPPPPSSSQQQQPFSFTAPKSSTTTSSSTLQPPPPPPPLLEQVRQLFHKDFLRLVNQWKDIHEQSTETLTEFLSFKNLLQQTSVVVVVVVGSSSSSSSSSSEQQSSLQVKQYLRKLEQFHTMLSQCITRDLKQLLFDMRALAQKIKSCVQSHVHSANQMETVAMDNGDYGFLCCNGLCEICERLCVNARE